MTLHTTEVPSADAPTSSGSDTINDTTIGVTGLRPRWSVSAWGAVSPWAVDGERPDSVPPVLDWFVAADDRWHVPAQEPTVRQRRIEGAPVLETRVRIPDGDAIQRVWAVPEHGGTVVVEFENESPLPIAVAVAGMRVVTERPSADVPIQGIELPDDAIVLPVGHHASVRVHLAPAGVTTFAPVPPALAVVRGWTRVTEQASRLVLPDETLVEAVNASRCDLLLEGPVDGDDDPVGFLLDAAELVRCGDSADAWMLEIVDPVERVARQLSDASAAVDRPDAIDALRAATLVAERAGDDRASGDLERIIEEATSGRTGRRGFSLRRRADNEPVTAPVDEAVLSSFADLRRGASVGRFVRSIERRIVNSSTSGGAALLPGGVPTGWLGTNFEVHGLPTGPSSTVSFAVRWHGERPAVLWEQHGANVRLDTPTIDPSWSTDDEQGEVLWAAPPIPASARTSLMVTALADEPADEANVESGNDAGSAAPSPKPNGGILSIESDGGSFA